jgi:uncharacterized protein (TIGR04255 family)
MSASAEKTPLPDYTDPPVVETVLGVQFDRLTGFKNAHLGAFWKSLDPAEWPTVLDAPPLQLEFERFTEAGRWSKGLQLQFTQIPASRLQIKNSIGDRMIQIQNTRLHFNWIGEAGGNYPRYDAVRDGFVQALKHFTEFVAQAKVGEFRPNQWEVTYINHILQGTVWHTPADWGFFSPLRSIPIVADVAHGESFTGEWHFIIPKQRGRLHVKWQHGLKTISSENEREIIGLTLTARGPLEPKDGGIQAVLNGLDLGRETIVRTFASLMNQDANKQWGLKDASD